MHEVVIRRATVADVMELTALRRAWTFEDSTDPGDLRADFETAFSRIVSDGIESGQWVVWVGELEGAIVSFAFVGTIEKIPRPIAEHRAIGYLTNVYTRPDLRDRGIGGRVLEAVTAWARESDVELLIVWPSEESVTHYERYGFADRGEPLVWLHPGDPT